MIPTAAAGLAARQAAASTHPDRGSWERIMVEREPSPLLTITPEQRRVAVGQFERANQVIATGNFDYGIQLLLNCLKLDPTNLIYRRTLRQTEKTKFKNNLRGSTLAVITTSKAKAQLKVSM